MKPTAIEYNRCHWRKAMSAKRWYWKWLHHRARQQCQHDDTKFPPTREWFLDVGYCIDNQTEGL